MASAKCAREECGKTVYPVEELKCLDKIWHKGCFRCTTCGMTLSMKTYKGYEKKPYCDAHYPKTVPSAFTASLDLDRAKQNTALQSSVKYHENYEKMKGTKIDVVDDPETKRLLENTQKQSLAHYHGEQRKKEEQDQHREHREGQGQQPASAEFFNHSPSMDSLSSAYSHTSSGLQNHPIGNGHGHQAHYAYGQPSIDKDNSPYTQRVAQQAHGTVIYSSEMGGQVTPADDKQVGSIADYDPMKAEQGQQKSAPAPAAAGGGGKAPAGGAQTGFTVKALYDYNAADKDEVSFKEGDVIVNCQKVDDGWFTGTVQRTLLWGMLPANYVEKVAQPTGMFRVK